jgi:predicted  nucleic acid-binding Zn-ribbon protein
MLRLENGKNELEGYLQDIQEEITRIQSEFEDKYQMSSNEVTEMNEKYEELS